VISPDDGGEAFPTLIGSDRGMSLRDYFAGQVIAGLMALPKDDSALESWDDFAEAAYRQADAMLAERQKE
jgi:hypothetical protein